MLRDANASPDSGRCGDAPSRSSRCGAAAAAGRGRREPGPPPPARPAPRAPRPGGTPAPRPAPSPGGGDGAAAQGRPRRGGTRRAAAALTSFSATSRISTCNNKAGSAEPRAAAAPARPPAPAARPPPPYLRCLLTRPVLQEPGDEEVELCAGERGGRHRAQRRARGRGRIAGAAAPAPRLTRSQLREAFPLAGHACGSLEGRRRGAPPPRGRGTGPPPARELSPCSRAEPRFHHSSNGGGGGGGGGGNNNSTATTAAPIPPPQKGVRRLGGLGPPAAPLHGAERRPRPGGGTPRPLPPAEAGLFIYFRSETMSEPGPPVG